jgi:hypothetical protein
MEHDMPAQVCRILLQTFWKNGIGWDDELKTKLYVDWKLWPPPDLFSSRDEMLRKQWRTVQHWTNEFWRRRLKEYLPTLQKRTRWQNQTDNLQVGDIVQLIDEGFTRGDWPIGRVVETHPGEDRKVRVVTVQTRGRQLKRPITKVARIEI